MTTDLKTVWLTKGTVVKIIAGSREGYIGKIVQVLHLSVTGCIYKVVLVKDIGYYDRYELYYTQEQVVEYTQQEVGAK